MYSLRNLTLFGSIFLLSFVMLPWTSPVYAKPAKPAFDATINFSGFSFSCAGYCVALTTHGSPDVIIANLSCFESPCSVSDSMGLTWRLGGSYCNTRYYFDGSPDGTWCNVSFYAIANSPISNDTITGGTSPMIAFGVSGVNLNSIFDPALPSGVLCPYGAGLGQSPCTIHFSTSESRGAQFDFVFVGVSTNDGVGCHAIGSGPLYPYGKWTGVGGGANEEVDFRVVNVAMENHFAFSFTCGGGDSHVVMAAFALQGVPAKPPQLTNHV